MVERATAAADFTGHAPSRLYGRIKDALAPAGVPSPGNHGQPAGQPTFMTFGASAR